MFPKDAEIFCNVDYGGSEGIYLGISVRYEKDITEFNPVSGAIENVKRLAIERFATGKTLGDTIDDLDRMNLVVSSVTAALYGGKAEVQERYAKIESSEVARIYPKSEATKPLTQSKYLVRIAETHHLRGNAKFMELAERIDQNYTDYQNSLKGLSMDDIFSRAVYMKAMSDAHNYMLFKHDFRDYELDFYLQFQNPLEVVGDVWTDRNMNHNEVGFVLKDISRQQENYLSEYPLMDDINVSVDDSLRRYMNINLEEHLGKIAEKVIVHHIADWQTDIEALNNAAFSDCPDDKRLFWQVCSFGTHMSTERETFIRDTPAYNTMAHYRENDPDIFGFYIEVTDVDDSDNVIGNVYEIGNYAEFAKHIRKVAVPLESITFTYSDERSEDEWETVNVSRKEFDANPRHFTVEKGNVAERDYHPFDEAQLARLISQERISRDKVAVALPHVLHLGVTSKLDKVRKPPEKSPEKKKPKTLAEKLEAANKKAKSHNAQKHGAKKPKERE